MSSTRTATASRLHRHRPVRQPDHRLQPGRDEAHAAGFDFGQLDPADVINIVGPGNLTDMANFTADACQLPASTPSSTRASPCPSGTSDGLKGRLQIARAHLLIANDYEMALIGEKVGARRGGPPGTGRRAGDAPTLGRAGRACDHRRGRESGAAGPRPTTWLIPPAPATPSAAA